jgi:hypothetical protein
MLTISKLKRWSINYYIDTAAAADAARDLARAGGVLGEDYNERETRTPVWLLAGDAPTTSALVGLIDTQRVGACHRHQPRQQPAYRSALPDQKRSGDDQRAGS